MKNFKVTVKEKVWLYPGKATWHFVTIQKKDGEFLKEGYMWPRRGFGAIPVNVTVGKTSWKTSIFPDKNGTFLLPLKKPVRDSENITLGSEIKIMLEVIHNL